MLIDILHSICYNIDTVKGTAELKKEVNRYVKGHQEQGYVRANAMITAWKLIRYRALKTKVNGTSFDNRQNVLQLLCKYNPADIAVKLIRDRLNAFDRNAIAVTAAVKGKVSAVIGYLPKAVASVIAALMDKGINVNADTLSIVGGHGELESYGARINIKI